MNWRWMKKIKKDKRFPQPTYLTCKAASQKLFYASLCRSKIFQFAKNVKSIETIDSPKKKGTAKIGVTELGRGIELPENYPLFHSYDPEEIIQKTIVKQTMMALDRSSAEALKQNALKITTSTATLKKLIPEAKWNDTGALLSIISGYMPSCAIPFERDSYIGIGGVRFLRAIKRHPGFLIWEKYLNEGDVLFNGEIGATSNVRWIQCLDITVLRNGAMVFGGGGLLVQEVQPLEIRVYELMIAFYGILGFAGQNVLHIPERRKPWV